MKKALCALVAGAVLAMGCKHSSIELASASENNQIEGSIEQNPSDFIMRIEERTGQDRIRYTLYFGQTKYADEEVYEFRPNGVSVFYGDNDFYGRHDGLADRIFYPDILVNLVRSRDYEENKEAFERGDIALQRARERAVEILKQVPGDLPRTGIRIVESF